MESKQRIEIAKANLKKAETAKIQAEAEKSSSEKQLQEIAEQMAQFGVTPETIQDEISKMDTSVKENLEHVERLIPQV
ncbi:hypothetical protein U2I54_16305 [Bacillus pseudomycoides]|uniref:Cytoplasmic protein n=1 Tax=Bacillus bingmayongensis TaxID=1150157 RepID=A0ABU5JYU4_9BACI|nr:hypothetical protein [Bacillus pseudomycoides]